MKRNARLLAVVCGVLMAIALAACGSSVDFKSGVQGTWTLYHYYERVEDGVDVFLDDSNYWTVNVTDSSFSISTADGSDPAATGGTYEWTKADEAEVVLDDGTRCTMRIAANDKKHNEQAMWDIYVVETNMYYVLEQPGEGA